MPQLETGFIPVADRCLLRDLCPSGMLSCHLKPSRALLLNLQNLTVVIRMQIWQCVQALVFTCTLNLSSCRCRPGSEEDLLDISLQHSPRE